MTFKKEDLKSGMIVEFRNGHCGLVVDDIIVIREPFVDYFGHMWLRDYNDRLMTENWIKGDYDIQNVYKVTSSHMIKAFLMEGLKNVPVETLWTREDTLKVTINQVAKKFGVDSVEIVDDYEDF